MDGACHYTTRQRAAERRPTGSVTAGGGSPFWVGVYLSGAAGLTLIALLLTKETKDISMDEVGEDVVVEEPLPLP